MFDVFPKDTQWIVGNPEATGSLKDRHEGYSASRISSILNSRANQFGFGCRPSQTAEFPVVRFHPSRRFEGKPQTHRFGTCIEC